LFPRGVLGIREMAGGKKNTDEKETDVACDSKN
jgi:hypothetical protein